MFNLGSACVKLFRGSLVPTLSPTRGYKTDDTIDWLIPLVQVMTTFQVICVVHLTDTQLTPNWFMVRVFQVLGRADFPPSVYMSRTPPSRFMHRMVAER